MAERIPDPGPGRASIRGGSLDGARCLKAETVKLMGQNAIGEVVVPPFVSDNPGPEVRGILQGIVQEPQRAARGLEVAALDLEPSVLIAERNFEHRSPEARKNNAWTIGTAIGQQIVTATATGANPAVFSVNALAGPAADLLRVVGDNQAGVANINIGTPPGVRVVDAYGNPVGNVPVTFTSCAVSGVNSERVESSAAR